MSAQDTKFYKKTECIFDKESPPLIMGILNITTDSFYDGGKYIKEKQFILRAKEMVDEGVDIIDIGAQSTRPGAPDIGEEEETKRLIKAIKAVRKKIPKIIISADTYRASAAKAAATAGANIINDISGGTMDDNMFKTISELKIPYILMHIQGTPKTMQQKPHYKNVTKEIKTFFKKRIKQLNKLGVHQLIIDPGFGFGKTTEHNYELLNKLEKFHSLKAPLMVGVSRKSMINKLLKITPAEALNATSIINTIALMKGVKIIRVHDVKEAKEAVAIIKKLKN